jgi:hypothetical protein
VCRLLITYYPRRAVFDESDEAIQAARTRDSAGSHCWRGGTPHKALSGWSEEAGWQRAVPLVRLWAFVHNEHQECCQGAPELGVVRVCGVCVCGVDYGWQVNGWFLASYHSV